MRVAVILIAILTGCAALAPVDAIDPRFQACGGTRDNTDATVTFTARDYHEHFPLMGKAPELESDESAFAVVFGQGKEPPIPLLPPLMQGNVPVAPPPDAFHRTVCIYVGRPPDGVMNVYGDVDVAVLLP